MFTFIKYTIYVVKIYSALKKIIIECKIQKKKLIKLRSTAELAVTSSIWTYQICVLITHNQQKFGRDKTIQSLMIVKNVCKYPKNAIKSKDVP